MNIILLGAPGVGKGTLATKLKERYQIPHISSGDIVRDEINAQTPFGLSVADLMSKGQLLPETPEFMGKLFKAVHSRLSQNDCRNGFILDGIPRRAAQVATLDAVLASLNKKIDIILLLEANQDILLARLTWRLICKGCNLSYHKINRPPKNPGICDVCGYLLVERPDDRKEIALQRLKIYQNEIELIIQAYQNRNLHRINTENGIESIFGKVNALLFPRNYLESTIEKYPSEHHKLIQIYNLVDIYKNPNLIRYIVGEFSRQIKFLNPDYLVGPEARALPIFGALINDLSKPGIFVRKGNKLPSSLPKFQIKYQTSYSEDSIEMYADPKLKGATAILIDDGLSSGGTLLATIELLKKAEITVIGIFIIVKYHYAKLNENYEPWNKITHSLFDLG